MAMVGDGKTDLEAKQAGAMVIGFGGVMQRDIVMEQADIFVNEVSLMAVLPHLV
jgi:phosphoserine phosphatase